jgi:hypothetical protein
MNIDNTMLIAILINRLGGKVEITQQEFLELDRHTCVVYTEKVEPPTCVLETRVMEVSE